nr:immunoglobulin heavy chain junction region [Macaca mulatta]MOX14713.1 immunoglobulin heavy chain junction region [Macaca mulatta]MOX14910.1 immunoglobulin heavy chain junction region [Macaca mulatta]MOX15165.1 immunoglobulin heavy chain junction region [Macaca mulatta]MOX15329.1 immunoglobulin heavy chain junction region [Macaca mulatta]
CAKTAYYEDDNAYNYIHYFYYW